MRKQPRTDADLPKIHTDPQYDYIPAKARDEAEIRRRQLLRPGTLVLEEQARGTEIGRIMLARSETVADRQSVAGIIALAGINSSWLTYARNADDVTRRRLALAQLVHPSGHRSTMADLRVKTVHGLRTASQWAGSMAGEHEAGRLTEKTRKTYGKAIGNQAVRCAVLQHNELANAGTDIEVQDRVSEITLDALHTSRTIGQELGKNPSLAQLPDPFSPYGIYIRDTATDGALKLYETAVQEVTSSHFGQTHQ